MKVVLFCGGLGMRLREYSEQIPKPMVEIGYRPLLWHIMKYYATFGHKDFILCLGYRADTVKAYFMNYKEYISNDFIFSESGKNLQLLGSDISDWKITFVYTGINTNVGQRLKAVEQYLVGEEVFFANYSDGLSDVPLNKVLEHHYRSDKVASLVSVRPTQSFHVVAIDEESMVTEILHLEDSGIWINGGYFIFKNEIFNYIKDGEELVEGPFIRLIAEKQLSTYKHEGFWVGMDTFKDKQLLDDMHAKGDAPWVIWKKSYMKK